MKILLVCLLLLMWPLDVFAQELLGEVVSSANSAEDPGYRVRIVYLIPSNRQPQRNAQELLQRYALRVRRFYREEMARLGYKGKTFEFETENGGTDALVHFAHVAEPDTSFHDSDYATRFFKILDGITSAGFPPFTQKEVLFVVAETHRQLEDGRFLESSVFFGGTGSQETGISVVTGETLARMRSGLLKDDRPYDGLIIPRIGPFPLVQGVTFPSFEGSTLSSTSSSGQGGAMHELGHAFALPHDLRNDDNFNGILMGNGFRGFRAVVHPERYPDDDVRLSSASALQLSVSRFFNPHQTYTDNTPPIVEIVSSPVVAPTGGLFRVQVRAFDQESSLAALVLVRNGNAVGELAVSESAVDTAIDTYDYEPGVTDRWEVIAYDAQGNLAISAPASLTPDTGFNRAPVPFVSVDKRRLTLSENVILDASRSFDPDGLASEVLVEWDFNGDGVFDTPPSLDKTQETSFAKPGTYQVVARLTDPSGDSSLSVPIGLRVQQLRSEDQPEP